MDRGEGGLEGTAMAKMPSSSKDNAPAADTPRSSSSEQEFAEDVQSTTAIQVPTSPHVKRLLEDRSLRQSWIILRFLSTPETDPEDVRALMARVMCRVEKEVALVGLRGFTYG